MFFFGASKYENTLPHEFLCCNIFAKIPNIRVKYNTIISSPTVITSDGSSLFSLEAKKRSLDRDEKISIENNSDCKN